MKFSDNIYNNYGTTLIEVLISLAVFSIGFYIFTTALTSFGKINEKTKELIATDQTIVNIIENIDQKIKSNNLSSSQSYSEDEFNNIIMDGVWDEHSITTKNDCSDPCAFHGSYGFIVRATSLKGMYLVVVKIASTKWSVPKKIKFTFSKN